MSDINIFVDVCGIENNITLARHLVDKVGVNVKNNSGVTGLMVAMRNNRLPIVKMLLDHPNILGKLHKYDI